MAHGRHRRHTIFHVVVVSARFLLYFLCAFNFLFLSRELSKPREKRATAAAAVSTGLLCFLYGFRITFSLRGARSALSSCVACFFRRRRRSMQQASSNDFYTSRHFYRFVDALHLPLSTSFNVVFLALLCSSSELFRSLLTSSNHQTTNNNNRENNCVVCKMLLLLAWSHRLADGCYGSARKMFQVVASAVTSINTRSQQ